MWGGVYVWFKLGLCVGLLLTFLTLASYVKVKTVNTFQGWTEVREEVREEPGVGPVRGTGGALYEKQ